MRQSGRQLTDAGQLIGSHDFAMPGVKLFDFPQAEAYSRRYPFLSAVTLPRGVVDLARDMPPANIRMIAPTATLVASVIGRTFK